MKLILASKSQRRIELLQKITKDFESIPATSPEEFSLDSGIEEAMKHLAYHKAREVYEHHMDAVVIGSDTLVFLGNTPIGKPKVRAYAKEMLMKMRGRTHQVYTSVAIISKSKEIVFVDVTDVTFKMFSEEELDEFLDKDEWRDKSGGYAIQSLDERYVESIDGDIYTVIGFPYQRVKEALNYIYK